MSTVTGIVMFALPSNAVAVSVAPVPRDIVRAAASFVALWAAAGVGDVILVSPDSSVKRSAVQVPVIATVLLYPPVIFATFTFGYCQTVVALPRIIQ